ncbi:MAG: hypothetical protein ACREVL_11325 [Solimonas sp.]
MRIAPTLAALLRHSLVLLAGAFAGIVLVKSIADIVAGRPLSISQVSNLAVLLAIVFCGAMILGLLLFGMICLWAAKIERQGLSGRSYWGRRRIIPWSALDRVERISIEGIPALRVGDGRQDIVIYMLGVDVAAVHPELCRCAGIDHPLPRALRS